MEDLLPFEEVKDYTLHIKIKNGPMLSIMRQNGFKNAAELHRASGVGQMTIGRYLNLKETPLHKTSGKWQKSILRIAKVLKTAPDFLFPQQHINKSLEKNQIEANVSLEEIQQLTGNLLTDGPEVLMLQDEKISKLRECLDCLTKKERTVIEGRFYSTKPKSLEEIGQELNVSRERIRQIQSAALFKIENRMLRIYPEYKE